MIVSTRLRLTAWTRKHLAIRWRSTRLSAFVSKTLIESANILFKAVINEPKVATEQWMSFLSELAGIAGGKSDRAPKAGDKRFSDATWKESQFHSVSLKAYLAWGDALNSLIDKT